MPTPNWTQISTKSVYIKPMGRKWRRVLWFDKKMGLFIIDMPKEFTSLFPDDRVEAKDVEAIEVQFRNAVYKWEAAAVTWRKVILYRFAINLFEIGEDKKLKVRHDIKSSFEKHPETAIGFEWEVCRERVAKDETRFFRIWEAERNESDWDSFPPTVQVPPVEGYRGRQEENPTQVLDWTPEREAFFESIEGSLLALIRRAQDFESQIKDPVKLDLLASSNTLLLAATAKDKS